VGRWEGAGGPPLLRGGTLGPQGGGSFPPPSWLGGLHPGRLATRNRTAFRADMWSRAKIVAASNTLFGGKPPFTHVRSKHKPDAESSNCSVHGGGGEPEQSAMVAIWRDVISHGAIDAEGDVNHDQRAAERRECNSAEHHQRPQ
jgi:hypothetical protein